MAGLVILLIATVIGIILASPAGFEQQLAPDFPRNFVLAAVFNLEATMKNEPQELRELLSRLSDAPVPSNFTARVMQAVELEEARSARKWNFTGWNWHSLLPRAAIAAVIVAAAGFAFHQHEIYNRRVALAKSVALVAQAEPLPSVDALKNFDAIQRMSQPAHADEELLALAPDLK
jgi:negative regulator of sigma E activity